MELTKTTETVSTLQTVAVPVTEAVGENPNAGWIGAFLGVATSAARSADPVADVRLTS